MSTGSGGPAVDEAVRTLLLLMPRIVGRAKRLPIPPGAQGLDLAPRHLALLAHLEYDGPASVSDLAARLEVAPTTISLMVSDLSKLGVLERAADPADRRRRIVAIAPPSPGRSPNGSPAARPPGSASCAAWPRPNAPR